MHRHPWLGPVSTGYVWKPSARTAALKVLNDRLEKYLNGGPILATDRMTCAQLLEQFIEARGQRLTKHKIWEYTRYMKAFVPPTALVTDTTKLRRAILDRVAGSEYATNTRRQGLKRIRTVFAFGIEQGWLQTNPVYKDMIPAEVVAEADPYTDEDLEQALEKLSGRNRALLQFLMATGCRAIEATRLQWASVKSDHIIVDGKRVRADKPHLRILPLALCPGLKEVLDEARAASWGGPELVFGVQYYQPSARAFSAAMNGKGRGFHDVRKWVINRWVRMGWPEKVIEAMAGHDLSVSKKHYRTPFTPAELTQMAFETKPKSKG